MAIYAMSDLHLALDNPEKTMEEFGDGWKDYMERIKKGSETVGQDDLYLMPGDLSWCTYLKNGTKDFEFINGLPGRKLLIRGNHDYWWGTLKKMTEQFDEYGLHSIEVLRNTVHVEQGAAISGTRGWKLIGDSDMTEEDLKIHAREYERLKIVLGALETADPGHEMKRILMMHYPPLTLDMPDTDYSDLIASSGAVDICIYGHFHGRAHRKIFEGEKDGTIYRCVSADFLRFNPALIV